MLPAPTPVLPSSSADAGAVVQPHDLGAPLDLIFIEGFTGDTVIGIHDDELHAPQPLVIDVHAGVPRPRACDSDAIADTVNYAEVHERLQALMRHHGVQLLEAFAEKIADLLLLDFRAAWVRVKVVKPRKFDNVQSVGVQIERRPALRMPPDLSAHSATTGGQARSAQVFQWMGSGLVPHTSAPPSVHHGR